MLGPQHLLLYNEDQFDRGSHVVPSDDNQQPMIRNPTEMNVARIIYLEQMFIVII